MRLISWTLQSGSEHFQLVTVPYSEIKALPAKYSPSQLGKAPLSKV
jgi:hypothetical protein